MRLLRDRVPLLCLCLLLGGCSKGALPISGAVTSLVPEDSQSTVMKANNYAAVTQAIARGDDITPFLKQQPDLAKKTFAGKTLLFDAAFFGRKDAVKALLDNGAQVNYTTQLGMTALDTAVAAKSPKVIALLKQHGGVPGKPH